MEGFNLNINIINPSEITFARPTMIVHGIVSQILFSMFKCKVDSFKKGYTNKYIYTNFDTHGVLKMYLCCNSTFINPKYVLFVIF